MGRDTDEEPVLELPPDVELEAEFGDGEITPVSGGSYGRPSGTCWKCWRIEPVVIVSPPPASSHEAARLTTCIESRDGRWAMCAVRMILRLGTFEIYVGPERRVMNMVPKHGERRAIPPREDGESK